MRNGEDYFSVGHLAQQFQLDAAHLEKALADAGVSREFSINGINHYTREAVGILRRVVNETLGEKHG